MPDTPASQTLAPGPVAVFLDLMEARNEHWIAVGLLTEASVARSPHGDLRRCLAALRKILGAHRPGADNRCQWCRNPDGQRAMFPCGEYLAIRRELLGEEAGDGEAL